MTEEELVELMAEPAHEAWMQWYLEKGYLSRKAEWGEEFMVHFDKLSEDGKELDRTIMRSILKSFSRTGLRVTTEYHICKERGHQAEGGVTIGKITWMHCGFCGTSYRYEKMLIEENAPEV